MIKSALLIKQRSEAGCSILVRNSELLVKETVNVERLYIPDLGIRRMEILLSCASEAAIRSVR